MERLIDIRHYRPGEYTIHFFGIKRKLPLFSIDKGLWLAANEHLCFGCDIEFTRMAASQLLPRLKRFRSQCLLTAEAKAIALTYELAKGLGHKRYAIARKELKENIAGHISVGAKSITTKKHSKLFLSNWYAKMIAHKNIILVDDVISTGKTIEGLMDIACRVKANVVAIACIWLEGPWPFDTFRNEIKTNRLLYLDTLPLFAKGKTYRDLLAYKKRLGF
jgi:adenine phosphoribosyltransferase